MTSTASLSATRADEQPLLHRAWLQFVEDGVVPQGISDEIVRSWRRARESYRIDPGLTRPDRLLDDDALHARRARDGVYRLATPVLQDFAARLGLTEHVLAYFDADGWMLSLDGHPRTVEGVSGIDFRPGANWSEEVAGTNGPGTALAEGAPVEVFAAEHFVEAWQSWSCAAAPVRARRGDAPVGVVDITGPWQVHRRQALLLAKAIARAIEERLGAASAVRDEVVRYAFQAATATGDALIAVDATGAVVGANDAAARQRIVERGALPAPLRAALARALGAATRRDAEICLDAATGEPTIASPVWYDGAPIGAILRRPGRPAAHGRAGRGRAASAARATAPCRTAARYDFTRILGDSEPLRRAVDLAQGAARNALPVVLTGESGTGKELFAHAIHAASARCDGPFVAVNCGSIPAELVEAELFGYEPGTFTGARSEGSAGRFEDAEGGTLFLDEVSELSPQAQTALLRLLQEREVVRLGGSAPRRIDVRVVAATNKPLEAEIQARRFRRDLYYRLNVLSIRVPALRERGGDVEHLARVFLAGAEAEVGRAGLALDAAAAARLRAHPWPGNVRELRNVLLRAAATAPDPLLRAEDLLLGEAEGDAEPSPVAPPGVDPSPAGPAPAGSASPRPPPAASRTAAGEERQRLLAALELSQWNVARAAEQLGISRMTLYRRLHRWGIARAPAEA